MARPSVWIFTPDETRTGYYEVVWAKDGDLNKSYKRGDVKRFRLWTKAKAYAKAKAKSLGVTLSPGIHR